MTVLGLTAEQIKQNSEELYREAVEAQQMAYDAVYEVMALPMTHQERMEALAQITNEGLAQLMATDPDAARQTMRDIRTTQRVAGVDVLTEEAS